MFFLRFICLYSVYVVLFLVARLPFSGWTSVWTDPRKHSKGEIVTSSTTARRIFRDFLILPEIYFTMPQASRKFMVITEDKFIDVVVGLHLVGESGFQEYMTAVTMFENPDHESEARNSRGIKKNNLATNSFLVNFTRLARQFQRKTNCCVLFFTALLFQSMSPACLCSCGLCLFISRNYCTAVHCRHGNRSRGGKIWFEPKAAQYLYSTYRNSKLIKCSCFVLFVCFHLAADAAQHFL